MYELEQKGSEYVSVSGLGAYIEEQHSPEWLSVSGLGQDEIVEAEAAPVTPAEPKEAAFYIPGATTTVVKETQTGMWLLLALAVGGAGYMYWRMRKAGVSLMPEKTPSVTGFDDFGHSGRTAYGVFPKHRGYGHRRSTTGRWHFHRRSRA